MESDLFRFEKLIVYQKSIDFIEFVYTLTKKFPNDEKGNLTDQFKRASVSVSLNIGEGTGGTKKEFNNFLRIAKRSIRECLVCITVSKRLLFITDEENSEGRKRMSELSKMCSGLQKSLKLPENKSSKVFAPNSTLPTPN
jgi:four helix bundle protein